MFGYLKSENGMSLTEVLVSMFLLAIVAITTAEFFVFGRAQISFQGHRLAAFELAQQRLEELTACSYDSVVARTETSVPLDNLVYTRMTTVEAVDDSADGLGAGDADGTDDYRMVTVTVSWDERGGNRSISLERLFAP